MCYIGEARRFIRDPKKVEVHTLTLDTYTHLPECLRISDKVFLECLGDTLGICVFDVRAGFCDESDRQPR